MSRFDPSRIAQAIRPNVHKTLGRQIVGSIAKKQNLLREFKQNPDVCTVEDWQDVTSTEFPWEVKVSGVPFKGLHEDPTCTLPALLKDFTKSTIANIYVDKTLEASQPSKPLALILPRRGLARGIVVHNDPSPFFLEEGMSMCFYGKTRGGEVKRMLIQTWDRALDMLKKQKGNL